MRQRASEFFTLIALAVSAAITPIQTANSQHLSEPDQSDSTCHGTSMQVAGRSRHCIDWRPPFISSRSFQECWKGKSSRKVCAPDMTAIPQGTFRMGATHLESGHLQEQRSYWKWQLPTREVRIRRPIAVGKYEVKVSEYLSCVDAGACRPPVWMRKGHKHNISTGLSATLPSGRDWTYYGSLRTLANPSSPIVGVSWDDAQSYVSWLNKMVNQDVYRLLSEAEWEYAARAGTSTTYPWGNSVGKENANCDGCGTRDARLMPVGSYAANRFGFFDMNGNVAEWVQDCFWESYQGAPSDETPWRWWWCQKRAVRGGAWFNPPTSIWSSFRAGFRPEHSDRSLGFRVARNLPGPSE